MARKLSVIVAVLSFLPLAALAQKDRLSGQIDRRPTVVLAGNLHPRARPQFDEGPVDPSLKMRLVTLMLKPSAAQQAALEQLLTEQQDPLSPNYHRWLTPEEYADRFALTAGDIARIVSWLQSEGFTVDDVSRGRNWIVFHGTAGQLQNTLHTEIRHFRVDGELHFANATEPWVPAALEPLIIGFQGLDDFQPKRLGASAKPISSSAGPNSPAPDFTSGSSHYLAPDDLATIYDITPLYKAGFDGSGQKIVIAGQTDIDLTDIRSFRSKYNLPSNDPQLVLVPGSTDPGTSQGDLGEADLDVEWSGAVARNATIIYVYSTNVETSARYAVSRNLAPVINFSYGICEAEKSGSSQGGLRTVAQQANAQGITWLASTGDSGAAGCDIPFARNNAQATLGLAATFPATLPEVTAVGGTQFDEGADDYWSATNSPSGSSALGYIPETAWNASSSSGIASTGGGLSIFYSKPSWQAGPGVPSANARAIPDVSLSASLHDAYLVVSGGNVGHFGGTSASTPAFAGLVALLNQYQVSKAAPSRPGQGNINPNLYRLAQSTTGVFHDITTGSNIVPCAPNTPNCQGGSLGYSAGPGYDLATGLGSVDANNFITQWSNQLVNTTIAVTANPTSFGLGDSTQVTATVTLIGSSGAPTGTVDFAFGNVALGTATLGGSGGNATAAITVYGSQLTAASDVITALYSGNSSFNGSSGSVTVNVSLPTSNSAVVPSVAPNPVYQQQPDADGYSWFNTVKLTEVAGVATTLTAFAIDGVSYTAQIASLFGTSSLPAHGTLSASLRARDLTVPTSRVFGFAGVDASGRPWSQQLSVPIYGPQITAAMALSSVPDTVRQNPKASSNCQWYQHLGVQELNGHSVQLTNFLAGGKDLSNQIQTYFGSTTLPALGSLLGSICWSAISPPQTLDYEIDGIDDLVNMVTATLSAIPFAGPAANIGTLSVAPSALSLAVSSSSQSASTNLAVNLTSGQLWTVSVFPSNRTTSWLVVYPQSGTGSANLSISASGAGLSSGAYKATLVFQAADALPQFIDVPLTFTVAGGTQPTINPGGTVNGASFTLTSSSLAPGSIAAIFGFNLSDGTVCVSPNCGPSFDSNGKVIPTLAGAQVSFNGFAAPILSTPGNGQLNVQIPVELAGAASVTVQVTVNGQSSASSTVSLAPLSPGLIAANSSGSGQGAILNDKDANLGVQSLVAPASSAPNAHPAAAGDVIEIYGTGLGAVTPPVLTGTRPQGLPQTVTKPTVTIGGIPATVSFSGLASCCVGLNQVNVVVPAGTPTGNAVPVVLTIGGVISNTVTIAVQ